MFEWLWRALIIVALVWVAVVNFNVKALEKEVDTMEKRVDYIEAKEDLHNEYTTEQKQIDKDDDEAEGLGKNENQNQNQNDNNNGVEVNPHPNPIPNGQKEDNLLHRKNANQIQQENVPRNDLNDPINNPNKTGYLDNYDKTINAFALLETETTDGTVSEVQEMFVEEIFKNFEDNPVAFLPIVEQGKAL
jgi:hypothetical protein